LEGAAKKHLRQAIARLTETLEASPDDLTLLSTLESYRVLLQSWQQRSGGAPPETFDFSRHEVTR
ncbi:MAG: hypothetical protein AAGJ83_07535, partial [Planctomycetota bacterium]